MKTQEHTQTAETPAHKYKLGQLILVECHNSKTKLNEWREAMFLHYHDAYDRPWRAEIEIDGRRVTGIAPECIKDRNPSRVSANASGDTAPPRLRSAAIKKAEARPTYRDWATAGDEQ